jgi:uncharacterized delta-60 repeat protein
MNMNPAFSSAAVTKIVPENTVAVGRFAATDADVGDVLTYSLSGPDAALFQIDAATGDLRFTTAPDFESWGGLLALRTLSDAQRFDLYKFFLALFDAAPGVTYFNQIAEALVAGLSIEQVAEIFATKSVFTTLYPTSLTNQEFAQQWVQNLVQSSANDSAKAEAVSDIVAALDAGFTRARVILTVSTNLIFQPESDPNWGATAKLLNNQVAYAKYYTEVLRGDTTDMATLQEVIRRVMPSDRVLLTDISSNLAAWDITGSGPRYTVTVTATDSTNLTAQQTVTVLVADVPDGPFAPVASGASLNTAEDTQLRASVSVTDLDSTTLTYSLVSLPPNGTVLFNTGTGEFIYTPRDNYNGPDSFSFKASDGALNSNTANVSINVTPVNDAPTGSVSIGGAAVDGQTLTVSQDIRDADGIPAIGAGAITYQWQASGTDIAGATGNAFTLTPAQVGRPINVVVRYTDNGGTQQVLSSPATAPVQAAPGAVLNGTGSGELIMGGSGPDTLNGLGGNDTLQGQDGADWLNGGDGDDLLRGGKGEDWFVASSGNDTFEGNNDYERADYRDWTAPIRADMRTGDVEKGGGFKDKLIGIARIIGTAYDDYIIGNTLDVTGGPGNDTLIGGSGPSDYIWYGRATAAVQVDLQSGVVTGGEGNDVLTSFERVTGSGYADVLLGNASDNYFRGDGAADDPNGGADTIDGREGMDTVHYRNDPSGVVVDLVAGTAVDGRGHTDRLISIEFVAGTRFADSIRGADQTNYVESLSGEDGNDTLRGGGGDDDLFGGSGDDTAAFAGNFSDYTVVYNHLRGGLRVTDRIPGRDGVDQLMDVETLLFADGPRLASSFPVVENVAPVAADVTIYAVEDTLHTGQLPAAFDANVDPVSYRRVGVSGTSGAVSVMEDGSFSFTPNANFTGTTSFKYQVSDGRSSAQYTVTVNVVSMNDAPVLSISKPGQFLGGVGGARAVTALPDGSVIVGGYLGVANPSTMVVKLGPDGFPEPSFGQSGQVVLDLGVSATEMARDMTRQPDGKLVIAVLGGANSSTGFTLLRLNPDGTPDASFGTAGKAFFTLGTNPTSTWAETVALQPDGKIVVAGRAWFQGSPAVRDYGVLRVNSDGTLDTSFGTGGVRTVPVVGGASDTARDLVIQPDGKILVAGYSSDTSGQRISLVRLLSDGSFDSTFGTDGTVVISGKQGTWDICYGIALQSDGKLLLSGATQTTAAGPLAGLVVRLLADGSVDPSFGGGDGQVTVSLTDGQTYFFSAPSVRPDGRILLPGSASASDGSQSRQVTVQLLPDGNLDSGFGVGGVAWLSEGVSGQGVLLPNGRFVVVGSDDRPTAFGLRPDGFADPAFSPLPVYVAGSPPVRLTHFAGIQDVELAALNSGQGNYSGLTVVLQRSDGVSADDQFSALGRLSFGAVGNSQGTMSLAGLDVGTFTNRAGTLTLVFNANATQQVVDETLASLGYANTSATPPASVGLSVTVNDANTGSQGSGGALADSAVMTVRLESASQAAPLQGMAYHWKSHVLLSGVNVSVGSAAAVQTNAGELFDLRAAKFDSATGTLSVEVWANASANFGNFDFRAATAGATAASFTSALPEGWTVTAGTSNPQSVIVGAISLTGLTGSVKLGTMQLTLPANTTTAEVAFSQIKVGSADGANQGLAMQARTTGVDGAYSFSSLGSQALQLAASRSTSDAGNAVTSADALAALRIAVGLNPNPDPDGASGPKTAPAISPYQIMAADVNGSGTVTSADALAILRMAVKLSTALPQEWLFVEETRDFWDEAASSGQGAFTLSRTNANWDRTIPVPTQGGTVNLVGILKGDVNGSWAAPAGSTDLDNTNPTYFDELAKKIGVPNQDQWGGPPGP